MPEHHIALDTVGQIFHTVPDLATPEQVESSLREILDDPTLELFWWDWEREGYVDVRDVPCELQEAPGRIVTLIEYESRKVGAVVHDPRLLDDSTFLETFVPTMRIAMERDRLHRDLIEKLDQLKASRLRIVEAAEDERRRLERNLHDGAQQRLIVVLLALRRLVEEVERDSQVATRLRNAADELGGAIEDLRELARGLHPPLLREHGLAAAVRAGAGRSSLPIELDLRIGEGLPPAVEAAAYYVCAEAVTNAVRHAQASQAWLSIVQTDATLVVEVRDDGIGGVSAERADDATGLGGLQDRVEALDGTLTVASPPGGGTRLVATFPLLAPSPTAAP